jgi:Stress responsive A/B Barrel Domain
MMLHNVYFWLKDPADADARECLIAGVESLRAIEVIRSLTIGHPAPTEDREVVDSSFDVSEHLVFDSAADQKIYQNHPVHRAFVERCEGLWDRVLVYDSQEV